MFDRDFAHLGIALCRALGIPARYISVYACAWTRRTSTQFSRRS
ncbi:MAG: transglutaminase domain-containing protein [Myxococcales bacterium]